MVYHYDNQKRHSLVIGLCLLVTVLNCIVVLFVLLPSMSSLYAKCVYLQSRIDSLENAIVAQQDRTAEIEHHDALQDQDILILNNITHSRDYIKHNY